MVNNDQLWLIMNSYDYNGYSLLNEIYIVFNHGSSWFKK